MGDFWSNFDIDVRDEEIADLKKQNADLKNGVCEHVAQNVLVPDCRICELALKEKRLEIVEKELKKAIADAQKGE